LRRDCEDKAPSGFNPAAINARDHDPKRAVIVEADGQGRPSAMLRPAA
jgi:hypothetical protein